MPDRESKKLPPYWAVPFSFYKEVTDFLRELETACILRGRPSDGTVSFGTIARCLHELERPDRAYRSVHITGTNGKTSVSRMTAALVQAGGMKVGLYTSPHLGHIRERISINGRPISEWELVDACNHLKSLMDWTGAKLTAFEFLTVAAFFAFRAAKVDYAVVEVGIGGRQDATNVIAPEVSVITNVDYDHMEILGHTLEQIAAEKSGIIKPFTPVVCGPMADAPRALILSRTDQLKAPLLLIGQDYEVTEFMRAGCRQSLVDHPKRMGRPSSGLARVAAAGKRGRKNRPASGRRRSRPGHFHPVSGRSSGRPSGSCRHLAILYAGRGRDHDRPRRRISSGCSRSRGSRDSSS